MSETETPTPETDPAGEDVPAAEPDSPEEFDAERAKSKISKANAEAKALRDRLKAAEEKIAKYDDAQKSESERATERLTAAEKRAAEAEDRLMRLEIATEKGLTPAQAKRLIGSTREEMEADADELLRAFRPAGPVTRTHKPREAMRTSRQGDSVPEETDPRKLAEKIPRSR